jgi:5-(carboxyamino)imidazole ribonucleotide synthase
MPAFYAGRYRDFDTVYTFGKLLDAITIEIENVNVAALEKLEAEGVKVYPKPSVLRMIKNKILQKEYYKARACPRRNILSHKT